MLSSATRVVWTAGQQEVVDSESLHLVHHQISGWVISYLQSIHAPFSSSSLWFAGPLLKTSEVSSGQEVTAGCCSFHHWWWRSDQWLFVPSIIYCWRIFVVLLLIATVVSPFAITSFCSGELFEAHIQLRPSLKKPPFVFQESITEEK